MPPKKKWKKFIYQGDPLLGPPPPKLAQILDRYRGQPDALITVLEEIQRAYGYLPKQELQYTARELGFPLSQVYGVATFYNLFQLKPPGRNIVRVCTGTACHVGKSNVLLSHLETKLGVSQGQTTANGDVTLQSVACVGACSLAPVVVVNDKTSARMTPEKAWEILEAMLERDGVIIA